MTLTLTPLPTASVLNNLFGRGKEPFWQQAYTNLVKFIILLHKVAFDYVTLFDVYQCAINPELLERKIAEAERRLLEADSALLTEEEYLKFPRDLEPFRFRLDQESNRYRAPFTPGLAAVLKDKEIQWEAENATRKGPVSPDKREQLEAVKRWHDHDWKRIEPRLRTSIVEGISVFLSLFDDNPAVKRTFCPPAECYDARANADGKFGKPLPSLSWLIENGRLAALNFPVSMNAGLAKALGVMLKLDFERAVLNRVPQMERNQATYFRQVLFLCDEYQHFATVGESEPTGDEKFFSLSRQPKCIPIIATQSISSLKSALPGESWRTLLQTFRTKIFLCLSDDFSARIASELRRQFEARMAEREQHMRDAIAPVELETALDGAHARDTPLHEALVPARTHAHGRHLGARAARDLLQAPVRGGRAEAGEQRNRQGAQGSRHQVAA